MHTSDCVPTPVVLSDSKLLSATLLQLDLASLAIDDNGRLRGQRLGVTHPAIQHLVGVKQPGGEPCLAEAEVVRPFANEDGVKAERGQLFLVLQEAMLPLRKRAGVVDPNVLTFFELEGGVAAAGIRQGTQRRTASTCMQACNRQPTCMQASAG